MLSLCYFMNGFGQHFLKIFVLLGPLTDCKTAVILRNLKDYFNLSSSSYDTVLDKLTRVNHQSKQQSAPETT